MVIWFPVMLTVRKMLQHLDMAKACQQRQAGWKLSKGAVRASDSFLQETNYLLIERAASSDQCRVAILVLWWFSAPDGSRLPGCRYPGCCVLEWASVWFGRISEGAPETGWLCSWICPGKRQDQIVWSPATSLVPAWGKLQTQSSALIQKVHHTSPALGWKSGAVPHPASNTAEVIYLLDKNIHWRKQSPFICQRLGKEQFSGCWRHGHQLSS